MTRGAAAVTASASAAAAFVLCLTDLLFQR